MSQLASAPDDFNAHVELLSDLTNRIADDDLRAQLRYAIEELVEGLNHRPEWRGCWVIWTSIPNDTEGLFDA